MCPILLKSQNLTIGVFGFIQDKACKDVEIADIGPASLDGKMSQQVKQEKLREEAQYEKERVRYRSVCANETCTIITITFHSHYFSASV